MTQSQYIKAALQIRYRQVTAQPHGTNKFLSLRSVKDLRRFVIVGTIGYTIFASNVSLAGLFAAVLAASDVEELRCALANDGPAPGSESA